MQNDTTQFPRGIEVVGSAIIERSDGAILLTRSPKWHDKWMMPGGHVEPGETIEEAIRREAEEETDIRLASAGAIISFGELIGSKDFHRPAHFVYFDVWFVVEEADVRLDGAELNEHAWAAPEEALVMEDLAESYEKTIQDFIAFKAGKRSA